MHKLFGILAVIGGWVSQITTGSVVEVNINKQWCKGTVIDSGEGKRHITVILDDDSLAMHKVQPQNLRSQNDDIKFEID